VVRPATASIGRVNDDLFAPWSLFVVAGLVGGILLFVRGLQAYRRDRLISSVATSSLDGIAAGEVRVSGVVEPIDQTLISPLQSKPCVWYRARVETTGKNSRVVMDEEKSQEFRIRDETGAIRVVPRGARWEIGAAFDERTSIVGAEPPGLARRAGASYALFQERDVEQMTELERQTAAQALLTVQRPATGGMDPDPPGASDRFGVPFAEQGGRRYREARLEPGDTVTILGQAWPWAEVREVLLAWNPGDNVEADIAADIAAARRMGLLAASPEEAWGNAAIPGFGIGAPTAQPALDPRAHQPVVPGLDAHEAALEKYHIPDEELVLSRGLRGGMAIYLGTPREATGHHDFAFWVGVAGAVMAVVCTLLLGVIVTGTL
jgi:hypothetical protein